MPPQGNSGFTVSKVLAVIVWLVGAAMTFAAIDQVTEFNQSSLLGATLLIQGILTVGQSKIWRGGRTDILAWVFLTIDTIINFAGVNALSVNIDQMGSLQALIGVLTGYYGEWNELFKTLLAIGGAVLIAATPEYLWKN